jgi:hypothetical protein
VIGGGAEAECVVGGRLHLRVLGPGISRKLLSWSSIVVPWGGGRGRGRVMSQARLMTSSLLFGRTRLHPLLFSAFIFHTPVVASFPHTRWPPLARAKVSPAISISISVSTLAKTLPAQSPLLTAYLVAYNTLSLLAWSYVLYTTVQFITTPHVVPPVSSSSATGALSATGKAKEFIGGLGSRWFGFPPVQTSPVTASAPRHAGITIPSKLAVLLSGSYAYKNLGPAVVWTQTGALLEVVHAALGMVKSSPVTVGMQVASRIWMVWGVVEQREEVSSTSAS